MSSERVLGVTVATPTSWEQKRAIDKNGVVGEWYECEAVNRGVYVTEADGGYRVGLYRIETDSVVTSWEYETAGVAAQKAKELTWDIHH